MKKLTFWKRKKTKQKPEERLIAIVKKTINKRGYSSFDEMDRYEKFLTDIYLKDDDVIKTILKEKKKKP